MRKFYYRLLFISLLLASATFYNGPAYGQNGCVINGADLPSYPGTTFPTTQPTYPGTSMLFGTGPNDEILMFLPLLPAGAVGANDPVNLSIRLYMKRVTADNDPIMGFTDGNGVNFCGFLANDGNSHFKVDGTLTGGTSFTLTYTNLTTCNGSCGTNVGDTYILDMDLQIVSQAVTTVDSTFQGGNLQGTTSTYTQTLDPSTGIRFMLGKQTGTENYQIDSVDFMCSLAPVISGVSADTTICEGDSVVLSVTAGAFGATSYQWYQNGSSVAGATMSSYSLPAAMLSDAGSYTCIVSNANGADTSSVIQLSVNPSPQTQIAGSGMYCSGSTVMLMSTTTGGTPGYSYLWMPGSMTTQDINVSPTGDTTFYLMVTDSLGCSSSDSLFLMEMPVPTVSAGNDVLICEGDSTQLMATGSGGTGTYSYTWQPGTLAGNPVMVAPTVQTIYTVALTDSAGCQDYDTVVVNVNAAPAVGYSFVSFNDSVQFNSTATSATAWSWDFGDGNGSSDENPGHVYTASGMYYVCLTVTDGNGCSATFCDSVNVVIIGMDEARQNSLRVYPNPSDGVFEVDLYHNSGREAELRITNMLGESVYARNLGTSPSHRLTVDLHVLPAGVYILHVKAGTESMVRKLIIE